MQERQLAAERLLVSGEAPCGVDPLEHEERRLAALVPDSIPSDIGDTWGTRTVPLDRSHSSPQASVPKKPAGGERVRLGEQHDTRRQLDAERRRRVATVHHRHPRHDRAAVAFATAADEARLRRDLTHRCVVIHMLNDKRGRAGGGGS